MKVILISGKARHGKDTVAGMIESNFKERGARVLVTHYADLVKYICKAFFGWDGNKDERGRTLLQYVGTDIVRGYFPDYWVNFIIDILNMFSEHWDYVIIPDTRFPNEVDKIKEQFDAVHVRVLRDGFESSLTEEQKNHPSETALDNYTYDVIIHNSGSMEDLEQKVKELTGSV